MWRCDKITSMSISKPIILREGSYSADDLRKLSVEQEVREIRDIFEQQMEELFEITHPQLLFLDDKEPSHAKFIAQKSKFDKNVSGDWIYFPWNKILVHMMKEEDFYTLRTNRNKNLITLEEQAKLYDFTLGFIGLSIGSATAVAAAHSGMSYSMKISDFDALSTSNLNRIRASVFDIGLSKTEITAREIYEINPYANIVAYEKGLSKDNLVDFFNSEPKPKAIIEAIDDFEMKIRIRHVAREAGVPVIMSTNLGDSVLFDIERYDLDINKEIFNGLIGKVEDEILAGPIRKEDVSKYAMQIVGRGNIPSRVLDSLTEIGKTLTGRPQLMGTVMAGSGEMAFLIRKIALKEKLSSGRYSLKFDEIFD